MKTIKIRHGFIVTALILSLVIIGSVSANQLVVTEKNLSGTVNDRWFGNSVALSSDGNTLVVGAPGVKKFFYVDSNPDIGDKDAQFPPGAAYVFYRNRGGTGNWGLVRTLTVSDSQAGDNFGYSVSLSGDTLVVGANNKINNWVRAHGAAYVFYKDQGGPDQWGQVTKIDSDPVGGGNYFGSSVSVNVDTIVVGATGVQAQGKIYIFSRNMGGPDKWGSILGYSTNNDIIGLIVGGGDGKPGDNFGWSVSASGNIVAAGAPDKRIGDGDGVLSPGLAYVYYTDQLTNVNSTPAILIQPTDGVAGDRFGNSVSVSGNTLVVGASSKNSSTGAAYIFYRDQNTGKYQTGIPVTVPVGAVNFGSSVSVNGDNLAVGASGSNSVYVFSKNQSGIYVPIKTITASDSATGDSLGSSVSLASVSGSNTVAVGAPYKSTEHGSAYAFSMVQIAPVINLTQGAAATIISGGSYDFGNTDLGSSSLPITFTIHNTGTDILNLTGSPQIAVSGANASDFITNKSSLTSPVAKNGSTSFTVTFAPSSGGSRTATISIANDDSIPGNNPYMFTLTGTGIPVPKISLMQGTTDISGTKSYDFGNIPLQNSSQAITFMIQNMGTADLNLTGTPKIAISGANASDFTINQNTVNSPIVKNGGSTSFTVTFAPSSAVAETAVISIASDDAGNNPYKFMLTGTGVSVPKINLMQGDMNIANGGAYYFKSTTSGTNNSAIPFTIQNIGTADLNLTGTPKIAISGANASDFTIDQSSVTFPIAQNGGSTSFTVTFTPSSVGTETAVITIANNDVNRSSYTVNLTGTKDPLPKINMMQETTNISSGGSYDFKNIPVGTSSSAIPFTIQNIGTDILNLTGTLKIAISGANASDFTIDQSSVNSPIAAQSSAAFTIIFKPSAAGLKTAFISIGNNDSTAGKNPYTVTLNGTGIIAPKISLMQDATDISDSKSYDFGSISVGADSGLIIFTIKNTGNAALNLTGTPKIAVSGANASDFIIDQSSLNSPIAVSSSATFTITFKPSSAAAETALITIVSNDSNQSSYTFSLTGTGTSKPVIKLIQGTTDIPNNGYCYFRVKDVGGSSTVTFTIHNAGIVPLNLTGSPQIAISGTNKSDFTIDQTSVTSPIAASQDTTFSITFTLSSASKENAQITIANDDVGAGKNPYTVNLVGTKIIPGDLSGNGTVDLADAILALRTLSGVSSLTVFSDADVNGDGRVGLEEVVYILQIVAQLR